MARIVAMEDAANRGDMADLQWFWHHMLQTDVTVAAAVAKRLSHIDSLDWEIRAIETADPLLAQEQAAILRYAYDRIENLKEAAAKVALGLFTGFTMLEKVRTGYGPLIAQLESIPGTARSPVASPTSTPVTPPSSSPKPCTAKPRLTVRWGC